MGGGRCSEMDMRYTKTVIKNIIGIVGTMFRFSDSETV